MMDETTPDRRPVPDPTILTTQQLTREITALKELVAARFEGADKVFAALAADIARIPSDVDRRLQALKDVVYETFKNYDALIGGINTRFLERDKRVEVYTTTSKEALEAAFTAQKETMTKAEATTTKQIDQIQLLLQTATHALDGKINDVKERITIIEAKTMGQQNAKVEQDTSHTQWVGIIGLVMGTVVGVGGLLLAFSNSGLPPPQVVERIQIAPPPGPDGLGGR